MENYFHMHMDRRQINAISNLGLAHIGDGVFELLTRSWICAHGDQTVGRMHRDAIALVRAGAQAKFAEQMLPLLTEEEEAVFKRGRNAHTVRSGADYHRSTGLEALFGYLYLAGRIDRVRELFILCMEE